MNKLTLFGTQGCHLCDEAEQILAATFNELESEFDLKIVDISLHEHYMEKYAIRIPVLYAPDSQSELCWPFDKNKLYNFLADLPKTC